MLIVEVWKVHTLFHPDTDKNKANMLGFGPIYEFCIKLYRLNSSLAKDRHGKRPIISNQIVATMFPPEGEAYALHLGLNLFIHTFQ